MTIEAALRKHLDDHAMFDSAIDAIIAKLKSSPIGQPVGDRWGEPIADYPGALYTVLLIALRRVAVEWIDENMPAAWMRSTLLD